MILSFRCSTRIKQRIDDLLATGIYPDLSTFCMTAIENQLLLEEEMQAKVAVAGNEVSHRQKPVRKAELSLKNPDTSNEPGRSKMNVSPTVQSQTQVAILDEETGDHRPSVSFIGHNVAVLDLSRFPEKPSFPMARNFPDVFRNDQTIPLDRWIFGQCNRLLPAKVSCRSLALISTEGKDHLQLDMVGWRIAEAAAKFGSYLRSLDRHFGLHRDDSLATAFPEEGDQGSKGRIRYQNHFVGHTVKGEQGGLLVGLKLAVIQPLKNKPHILLTVAGWDFARLRNPLLDSTAIDAPSRFDDEEVSFLLRHIEGHVPVERYAYSVVLSLIARGNKSPESVGNALAEYLAPGKNIEDEQDYLTTQRTGVLGRMNDLNLINRERNGTRICYQLTSLGKTFLDEIRIPRIESHPKEISDAK